MLITREGHDEEENPQKHAICIGHENHEFQSCENCRTGFKRVKLKTSTIKI